MAKVLLPISQKHDRVVVLVDMDCFYCQVEEKLAPALKGKPVAVVQYNQWQGGGIIAVNYAARDRGVTRHMRGAEAKKHCPDIELVRVPSVREKADLSKYRDAGKEVAVVLQMFASVERASVDEAYLDITDRVADRLKQMNVGDFRLEPDSLSNTYAVGFEHIGDFVKSISDTMGADESQECLDDDLETVKRSSVKLLIGAAITNEIRAAVKEKTGYECSAGIAHNKMMAKLVCGMNKPNKQTVLPIREIADLFKSLPVSKVKGLGGKFGEIVCETLKLKYVGDLVGFSERDLQNKFDEKNGSWLYLICRGIDLEAVTPRHTSKSIGCCKKFPGKNAITGIKTLKHWLHELATEIHDRLEKDFVENHRKAHLLTVSYMQTINSEDISSSRSIPLDSYEVEKMADDALECLRKNIDQFLNLSNAAVLNHPIKFLGLNVGKFEKVVAQKNSIQELFRNQQKKIKDTEAETKEKNETMIVTADNAAPDTQLPEKKLSFFERHFLNRAKLKETEAHKAEDPIETADIEIFEDTPVTMLEAEPSTSAIQIRSVMEINSKSTSEVVPGPSKRVSDGSTCSSTSIASDNPLLLVPDTPSIEPPAYARDYAEFYYQNLNVINTKKPCEKCDKMIASYEYETHQDWHMAMNLSQSQRVEFRQSLKSKTVSKPSSTVVKNSPSTQLRSIATFFAKSEEPSVLSVTPIVPEDAQICADCGKSIKLLDFPEHCDYHAAKKLQLELNPTTVVPVITKVVTAGKKQLNRKNKSSSNIAKFFKNE